MDVAWIVSPPNLENGLDRRSRSGHRDLREKKPRVHSIVFISHLLTTNNGGI